MICIVFTDSFLRVQFALYHVVTTPTRVLNASSHIYSLDVLAASVSLHLGFECIWNLPQMKIWK
jgi:hypothetical protein